MVDIGRCHCVVCLGDDRHRIRDGHCRDCKSNLRDIEAIGADELLDAVVNFSRWTWPFVLGAEEESAAERRTNARLRESDLRFQRDRLEHLNLQYFLDSSMIACIQTRGASRLQLLYRF